ncbi:MAG: N-formylglutamate amidohydrolase [Nitrospinota bacterium]|nr:N-formylglutamate amidohydrolase [Nitrospinota bacterium]MDH5678216.1 N-formylglutamate amidohydrolase [Nitrospinota bacterium]
MKKDLSVIVSCEHAVNQVPPRFRAFVDPYDRSALNTHAGYDIGALPVARALARRIGCPIFVGGISRLVVDLNRSETNRQGIFGSIGRKLDAAGKEAALEKWHRPFRLSMREALEREMACGRRVMLLSVHSFTPRLDGQTRKADFGLLYDPARSAERALCRAMGAKILASLPTARIRMNYPYRGVSDGSASAFRKLFPGIVAVELEFNQGTVGSFSLAKITEAIATSIKGA